MRAEDSLLKIFHTGEVLRLLRCDNSLDAIKTTLFWNLLERCLKSDEYHSYVDMGPFGLILDKDNEGMGVDILKPSNMGSYLSSGITRSNNVLVVDYNGKDIEDKRVEQLKFENYTDALKYSKSNQAIVFFISGFEVHVCIRNDVPVYIPDIFSHKRTSVINKARLPISEYRKLIVNHHDQQIYKEKGPIKYWRNKSQRLLCEAPENNFRKCLGYYLDKKVNDGTVDQESLNAGTANKTDIRVIRFTDDRVYIIEIKWLGRCAGSKTHYSDDRANEGIVQLNEYLRDETRAICGVLVLYDARDKDEEIDWLEEITWDNRIDKKPLRFFLISQSASKEAKRVVKESKKRTKDS